MSWNLNYSNTRLIPCEYEYYEPRSLSELVELLSKFGQGAKILAGGTDLIVQIKMGLVRPKCIVNIKRIGEMRGIVDRGDHAFVGALTTMRELERSELVGERFPALRDAALSVGSWQIRCLATVGGNLCNASPAADTAPPLLAYDAELVIYGPRGFKSVPIDKFFVGPKRTALSYDEVLYGVRVPYENRRHSSVFLKVARTSADLAKVSVAVRLVERGGVIEDVAIALGSVAPTPVRARTVESYLRGREFSEELVREASKLVARDVSPITDVRSTAEYRRHLSQVLVHDALLEAHERLP